MATQLWEPCHQCGNEPVYLEFDHLCEDCAGVRVSNPTPKAPLAPVLGFIVGQVERSGNKFRVKIIAGSGKCSEGMIFELGGENYQIDSFGSIWMEGDQKYRYAYLKTEDEKKAEIEARKPRLGCTNAGLFIWKSGIEFKDIPKSAGMKWNSDMRRWETKSVKIATALIEYADGNCRQQIGLIEQKRADTIELSKAGDADIEIPKPRGLSYLGYQKAGIKFASERDNVLIGDEMGLGKTIQAIGVMNLQPDLRKILIICPATLRLNWARECNKWLVEKREIRILSTKNPETTNAGINIVNYDIVSKLNLNSENWDLLVADEVHYLKNRKARRTQHVVGLTHSSEPSKNIKPICAKKSIFMTGTPIVNRPIELQAVAAYLAPAEFGNWLNYAKRYCAAKLKNGHWDASGASNLDELQEKLRASIMVRRLKSEVLTELPAKIRQVITLPSNGVTSDINNELKVLADNQEALIKLKIDVEMAKIVGGDVYTQAVSALKSGVRLFFDEISRLRHQTALKKVPHIIENLTDVLENSGKVVVFAHHRDVIEKIANVFGDVAVVLTGETPMGQRQEICDRFQTDPNVRVFIGSITAAGVGITLTAASHVIFAELDWVPGNMSQAEDRCHRFGQLNSVLVQHIVFEKSIDENIAQAIIDKQAVIEQALNRSVVDVEYENFIIPGVKVEEVAATKRLTTKKIFELSEKMSDAIYKNTIEKFKNEMCLQWVGNRIDRGIASELSRFNNPNKRHAVLVRKLLKKYAKGGN